MVRFRRAATVLQGRRSVGGEITVTNARLLFTPNQLEHPSGGRPVDVPLAEVGEMRVIKPGMAGLRRGGLGGLIRAQVEIETPERAVLVTLADTATLVRALGGHEGANPGEPCPS